MKTRFTKPSGHEKMKFLGYVDRKNTEHDLWQVDDETVIFVLKYHGPHDGAHWNIPDLKHESRADIWWAEQGMALIEASKDPSISPHSR